MIPGRAAGDGCYMCMASTILKSGNWYGIMQPPRFKTSMPNLLAVFATVFSVMSWVFCIVGLLAVASAAASYLPLRC